jgi:hypothetical protein
MVASATKMASVMLATIHSMVEKGRSFDISTKKKMPENTSTVPKWKPTLNASR